MKQLAIDADSMIYKVIFGKLSSENIEEQYMDFCSLVKREVYATRKLLKMNRDENLVLTILLSPKTTFRNELSIDYKANRDPKKPEVLALQKLIYKRLDIAVVEKGVEADDLAITLSRDFGAVISAIDKDVKQAATTMVHDYNKQEWQYPGDNVEDWYIYQSILGDGTDGIAGAKGKGDKAAQAFIDNPDNGYEEWIALYQSEDDAIMNMRLVRMDQFSFEHGITLWTPDMWQRF